MNIRPLNDRVVVEPLEDSADRVGSLYIPDTAKEKPQQGTVVAVGSGKTTDKGQVVAMEVKLGDKVLYGKYSGTELKLEGKDYLILRESDVLAIVK